MVHNRPRIRKSNKPVLLRMHARRNHTLKPYGINITSVLTHTLRAMYLPSWRRQVGFWLLLLASGWARDRTRTFLTIRPESFIFGAI